MHSKNIYFLHIPKTSGMKMQYELLEFSKSKLAKNSPSVYLPGEFEFVFNPDIANHYNIICGHFGRNPIDSVNNLFTFSILRNPFEQYLSLAKYAAAQQSIEFTEEFLDLFITNNNDFFSQFEGMSGCDNPQSSFLFSKTSYIEKLPEYIEKVVFIDRPKSYADMEEKLVGITIGTVEKRFLLVNEVNKVLRKEYNFEIQNNNKIVNSTPPISFRISNRHKKLINEKTQIDNELYARVSESWRV